MSHFASICYQFALIVAFYRDAFSSKHRIRIESCQPHSRATLKHGSRKPETWVRNPESGIRNPEPGIRNPEPGIRNPEPGTRNPEPGVRNPEPGVRNPEPGIRDSGLGTRNPKIRNSETRIIEIENDEGKNCFQQCPVNKNRENMLIFFALLQSQTVTVKT